MTLGASSCKLSYACGPGFSASFPPLPVDRYNRIVIPAKVVGMTAG